MTRKPSDLTITQLLDDVTVHDYNPDMPSWPKDWFGVSTEDAGGIIAYFRDANDAYRFRLDYINNKINPLAHEES